MTARCNAAAAAFFGLRALVGFAVFPTVGLERLGHGFRDLCSLRSRLATLLAEPIAPGELGAHRRIAGGRGWVVPRQLVAGADVAQLRSSGKLLQERARIKRQTLIDPRLRQHAQAA